MNDKENRKAAFIADFKAVMKTHGIIVDKYQRDGETKYFFKIQRDDTDVNIEDLVSVVPHGN